MKKLSLVVPVYNEFETIVSVVESIHGSGLEDYEIVIVDDCSSDGTTELLRTSRCFEGCHVAFHSENKGKGAALKTGIELASSEYVVFQDADLEYDPRSLVTMLDLIKEGDAEVVYGSRFLHPDISTVSPFWHRFVNRFLTEYSNFYTGLRLTDMETCYKMFPRSVLKEIEIEESRFGIEPELTAKVASQGLVFKEIPIPYNRRSFEEGKKIGAIDGIRALYVITKYGLKFG